MTNEGPGDRGVGSRGGVVGSRGGQRGGGSGDGASTAIQYAQTLKEQTPCRPTAQIYLFLSSEPPASCSTVARQEMRCCKTKEEEED